jgi:hypothetical protein
MKVWPYIVFPIAFAAMLITVSMLFYTWWEPMGALPFLIYSVVAFRHNARRCVCGHRFASHHHIAGMCFRCRELEDVFHHPITVSEAAEQILERP